MEENKYFTPELTDFRVGYEYEHKVFNKWCYKKLENLEL